MNVKEMREWLKKFPDETEVEVVVAIEGEYSTRAVEVKFDPISSASGNDGYSDHHEYFVEHSGHKSIVIGTTNGQDVLQLRTFGFD